MVYLQTNIRSRALESALEVQMPSVDVIVVGRYRDFARGLAERPDAALALEPVLRAQGLSYQLRGTRGGQDTESYVLLSTGAPVAKEQRATLVLGAVDLLGRERMGAFVQALLGTDRVPDIKYVLKSEDLLSLLQFKSVDAVVLSTDEAQRIRAVSKLALTTTPLETRVGLVAASFETDAGRRLIRPIILGLDVETKRRLGVDAWR
jgi:hypothetical protein